ncbi:MAG: DUF1957 domain-containing protein [Candidatus Omnitrophica bacterium]|nr:DUF1957 domain-containing protein [Candidatus Omnitrophota bacterium]
MSEKGLLSIVLHAHLPFVRHPEHDYFLEENWLYEAITETYIPLIHMFEGLEKDCVPFRLTMTMTPSLTSMLRDQLLQERYIRHIDRLIELAAKEVDRTRFEPAFHQTALHYYWVFTQAKETFCGRYGCDLTRAFRHFQDRGYLEIITCGATHGFLPLNNCTDQSIRGQIQVGARYYEEVFGRSPIGIWLPECGYYQGVDNFLKEVGIRYFLTDTHGVLHASPRPKYGVFAPIYCPSGVAAFGRDVESSKQVWSAQEGYPGDYDYREYYRDIGYDLDYDYIKPYIAPDGLRVNTGIKYYRITGHDYKQPYERGRAMEKAALHAGNFLFNREKQVEHLFEVIGKKPIIVAPYDAELYGHWWYEGPDFLNFLIRKTAFDQKAVRLVTPGDYLREQPVNQVATPAQSSWGYKGYAETWLGDCNHWIYRHLHKASYRMTELADRFRNQNGLVERGLKQAARELLLAQSSDWAFIMHTGTMVPYAEKRTKVHLNNFTSLYEQISHNHIDEGWLSELERRNNIFANIDYRIYCSHH